MLLVVAPLDHRYEVLTDDVRVTLLPAHIAVDPVAVIVGVAGFTFTVIGNEETAPSPQEFVPLTVMFPEPADVPKSTVMLFVVLVPVAPVGNVHV